MGTGISMSSVNKIKELAENGDYSLALDILEHQDLTKSLSPQFIRICGEVYYENQKYAEARAALVKAHSMAPMGNKIILSIIKLYLSMGLFELAEHYFEIYKFNQNTRDVGTVRIEYLIAKAYRKSIIELYSILISANEMETDEEWDMEMLFLHAAMKNGDKLKTESSIFKATYKNSTRLNEVEMLLQDMEKANEYIYIYPENAVEDTDDTMEETRQLEKKILNEDNLRMNPKDPKIMIMVEDDEPIPSSIKFKTMFSRSKENKREKKERKAEEKEEKTGWFGKNRLSKKDEEAFEEAVNEMAEGDAGRQELLDEVLKPDDTIEQPEGKISEEMVEITDTSDAADKAVYNDNVDEIAEKMFEEAIDDFSVEDEAETVVMVDVDSLSDEKEMFEEAIDDFSEDEAAIEADDFSEDEAAIETDDFSEDEAAIEADNVSDKGKSTDFIDVSVVGEAAVSDDAFESVEEAEGFDFDSAFESLDGFELNDISETAGEAEIEETPEIVEETNKPEISEISEIMEETNANEASEKVDDTKPDETSDTEETETAEESEAVIFDEDILFENKSDNFDDMEYETDTDDIPMVEISEMEVFDDVFDEDGSDGFEAEFIDEPEQIIKVEFEEETEAETDMESYDEPEPVTDKDLKAEEKTENKLYRRNIDFPVFKTSLFPDYNRDNPPVYTPPKKTVDDEVSDEQEKIKENLKKEEDLLSETDRLLARLGIELGTDYHSDVDFETEPHDRMNARNSVQTSYTEEKADMEDKNSFKLRF